MTELSPKIRINTMRNLVGTLVENNQNEEARRQLKALLLTRLCLHNETTAETPDFLVSDAMVERFMEIKPPWAMVIPEYHQIVDEIETTYVLGQFFSALASSCVAIERTLNLARVGLHEHHPKIKELWSKDAVTVWQPNIDALKKWGYLEDDFADKLGAIYRQIRCNYLHSGDRYDFSSDARRCVAAAYKLLEIFLGYPTDLFDWPEGRPRCRLPEDPRFKVFYQTTRIDGDEAKHEAD